METAALPNTKCYSELTLAKMSDRLMLLTNNNNNVHELASWAQTSQRHSNMLMFFKNLISSADVLDVNLSTRWWRRIKSRIQDFLGF